MKIVTEQYCNLARSKDFQQFLRKLSPDLYKMLIKQLQLGESCRENRKKMIEIQEDLKSRGLLIKLQEFLLERFPHAVIKEEENFKQETQIKKMVAATADDLYNQMNFHKVFEFYRPRILSIPQRHIIIGPTKPYVVNQVNKFVRNKLDIDYIILKGSELWHGYIEYFDARFSSHIKDVNHNQRPIAQYRKRMGISR